MRNIREILRLRLSAGLSIRQIRRSTKVSVGTIQKLLAQAAEMPLTWPQAAELDDASLARLFYPDADTRTSQRHEQPDWAAVHQELKHPHVTKQLVWEEYAQQYPNRAYSYSQFCDRYRQWLRRQKRSMRQLHKAGEKCFVDYAGQTIPIINAATGEVRDAQIFVGVLGASNYTFAEATLSQSLPDWLGSHVRMLEYFGGCPELMIPDNLRSGVSKACRYDPDLNPSYQQFASHYAVAVMPARPYKPKDKSKAEVGVQIIERWILARLRKLTFFSLAELNHCISSLLEEVNSKPFKQLPGNRRQAFETLDKPALKPLPRRPYQYVAIKDVKVNIDYHVQYEQHHYSAPHEYVGEILALHASDTQVQLFFRGRQVAAHPRKHGAGITTQSHHMPTRHRKHQQWNAPRIRRWAGDIGEHTARWVGRELTSREHEEQAYRACLGLLNLGKTYTPQRLEAACRIANQHGLTRVKQVRAILQANRDQLPEQLDLAPDLPQHHDNIRGPKHFH